MISFVKEIAEHCRAGNRTFYIFPQNGEAILQYDNGTYLNTISGIGVESIWYEGVDKNPAYSINKRLTYLNTIRAAGKPVLSVDYVDEGTGYSGNNKERIDDYYSKCNSAKYVPYAALEDTDLNEINTITGVQPQG